MTHQPEEHPRKGHRRAVNVRRICKDIRVLGDSIDRLWKRSDRRLTWGVAGDSQHLASDMAALHRVVKWVLDRPAITAAAYHAAIRLRLALQDLSPPQEDEIRLQLRIAALCVTVTLKQQADGSWLQLPIKDAA